MFAPKVKYTRSQGGVRNFKRIFSIIRGRGTLDGLGLLVYQGAIGFKMWTGLDAPIEVMRQALAKAFG
jgi:shikimate 5-dehydrogenase